MIDTDSGQPPWVQLTDILRQQIVSGTLTGRLPSVRTLSQEYGLAMGTVGKAMEQLRAEGLIVTVKGWGSSVAPDAQTPRPSA